jgi:hypothetical protein
VKPFAILMAARRVDGLVHQIPGRAQEPSLWELSKRDLSAEAYRFTYLRSFDSPIAVRLIVTSAGSRLVSKTTSGKGGFEPGLLIRNVESPLSKEATTWFLSIPRRMGQWQRTARSGLLRA